MQEHAVDQLWDIPAFFSDGARLLGHRVHDLEPTEESIAQSIREGWPVICTMRPGDFTERGHFIVLCDIDGNGTVAIKDPVSIQRTEKRWELESFVPQIKML